MRFIAIMKFSKWIFIPLKKFEDLFTNNEIKFYRINRQNLATINGIRSFEKSHGNKLNIMLSNNTSTYLNKNKASDFKQWFATNSSLEPYNSVSLK